MPVRGIAPSTHRYSRSEGRRRCRLSSPEITWPVSALLGVIVDVGCCYDSTKADPFKELREPPDMIWGNCIVSATTDSQGQPRPALQARSTPDGPSGQSRPLMGLELGRSGGARKPRATRQGATSRNKKAITKSRRNGHRSARPCFNLLLYRSSLVVPPWDRSHVSDDRRP